jgi:hypothetical protein
MNTIDLVRMLIRDARAELSTDRWINAEVDGELAACLRRLDEPLHVALVGTLKSGKSTLSDPVGAE